MRTRASVLGLGNVLMGDDAVGPYAVRTLHARYEFPEGVSVIDLGTPGLDLTPHLADAEAVIILDAVRAQGKPGDLRLYRRDQILRHPPPSRLGPHEPGLKEALLSLEFAGGGPGQVLLIGVIPEWVRPGVGMSLAARGAIAAVEAEVLAELVRLGIPAAMRVPPDKPEIWWETPADGA